MADLKELLTFALSPLLGNNYGVSIFLGCCLFLRAAQKPTTAVRLGLTVTAIVAVAAPLTFMLYRTLLLPRDFAYMHFALTATVLAGTIQVAGAFIRRRDGSLYQSLGGELPLTLAALGVTVVAAVSTPVGESLAAAWLSGIVSALGFTLVLALYGGVRERLELTLVDQEMPALPLALLTVGLMAIAFIGLQGLIR